MMIRIIIIPNDHNNNLNDNLNDNDIYDNILIDNYNPFEIVYLNEKIEDGNIIDWRNFNILKTAREPGNCLGLEDLICFENFFEKLYKENEISQTTIVDCDSPGSSKITNLNQLQVLNDPITTEEVYIDIVFKKLVPSIPNANNVK